MITEEFQYLNQTFINNDIIKLPELNSEEILCFHHLVEIFRHFIEIDNLFNIVNFNLMNMLHFFTIHNTDRIKRNFIFEFETTDHIAINALTNNLLSSGKTLIEAIEIFLNENYKENPEVIKSFKAQCLSKKYDSNFQYRLLLRMRDFSQHGHLPIDIDENNRCSFDLDKINTTPHFRHNAKLYEQMQNIINEIKSKMANNPRIAFSLSIAEYKINITEIYSDFLNTIENTIQNAYNNMKELTINKPELIYKSNDSLNGHVIYKIDDNNGLHMFNPKGETMKIFQECKDNVKKAHEYEKKILDLFNSNTETVSI